MEQIYTIPINEAFDRSRESEDGACPLCLLCETVTETEVDRILGASMMEPDVRIRTNREGFCRSHYAMLLGKKNRLGLALMLESHLDEVSRDLREHGPAALLTPAASRPLRRLGSREESCYLCGRIGETMGHMVENIVYMAAHDPEFLRKLGAQPWFCLPHYRRLLAYAKGELRGRSFHDFYHLLSEIEERRMQLLREQIGGFCRKFDYRYAQQPWEGERDAPERVIRFLRGCEADC